MGSPVGVLYIRLTVHYVFSPLQLLHFLCTYTYNRKGLVLSGTAKSSQLEAGIKTKLGSQYN